MNVALNCVFEDKCEADVLFCWPAHDDSLVLTHTLTVTHKQTRHENASFSFLSFFEPVNFWIVSAFLQHYYLLQSAAAPSSQASDTKPGRERGKEGRREGGKGPNIAGSFFLSFLLSFFPSFFTRVGRSVYPPGRAGPGGPAGEEGKKERRKEGSKERGKEGKRRGERERERERER